MQLLHSALSSNEPKALYVLLPLAILYTPSRLLNGAYNPDTRYKAPREINIQLTGFSVYCQVLIYS